MPGYTALPTKNPGDLLTSALWNTYLQGNAASGFMRMLADTTLAVAAASVVFSTIDQNFAHLLVVAYARDDNATVGPHALNLQFNGDTAANYDFVQHTGSGSSSTASEAFAQTSLGIGLVPGGTAPGNLFAETQILIPHYTNALNNKAVDAGTACKVGVAAGNLSVRRVGGFWRSNAAINQITLIATVGNLAAGSRFTLLGIPH